MPQLPTSVATTDVPWSYTVAAGMQPLALPSVFTAGRALGISTDGTYIVGVVSYGNPPNTARNQAAVWISGVPQLLDLLPGGSAAEAAAVSDDKSTIVGQCKDSNGHVKAVKWIASGGVFGAATLLGDLHGGASDYAQAVNSDGTIIYGSALDGFGTRYHYVKWVSGVLTMIFTNTQDYVFGTNYLAGDTVYYLGTDYEAVADNNGAIAPNAGFPWNFAAVSATAYAVSQNGTYSCGFTAGDGIPIIHAGPIFNGAPVNEWLTTNETLKADSEFVGVSNDGICAGFSYDDALTNIFATFWHGASTLTALDHGTATTNRAFAIASDSSQIAGWATISGHARAVTWAKTGNVTYGSMTNLGVLPGGSYSVGTGTGISTVAGYGDFMLPPDGLACGVARSTTNLSCVWQPPSQGATPATYNLRYQIVGASTWTEIDGITVTEAFLTGLAPGQSYTIEVQSAFGATVSAWSAPIVCASATDLVADGAPPVLTPVPLSYDDRRTVINTAWTVPGQICILQLYPMPVTITATIPEVEVGDTPSQ